MLFKRFAMGVRALSDQLSHVKQALLVYRFINKENDAIKMECQSL